MLFRLQYIPQILVYGNGVYHGTLDHEMHLQVFCVFLFLCAASLFGTIIAQVNEIVADLTTKKKDLDRVLEIYLALPRLLFTVYFE